MDHEGPGPLLRAGVLVTACFLILAAPVAGYVGLRRILMEVEPLNWPSTKGLVTTSMIEQSDESSSPDFRLRVTYDYEIDGKAYSSKRVYLDDRTFGSVEEATAAKAPFARLDKPVVFYDPRDPSQALLVRGTRTSSWVWLFSPLLLAGVGGLMLWGWLVVRRDLRKKKIPSEFDI